MTDTTTEVPGTELVWLPVGDLVPHPDNPNDGDVGAIGESIDRVGFYGTIVAQAPAGRRRKHRILAGEHRWLAAKAKGIATVPVCVGHWSDTDALAILLGDNEIARLASVDESKRLELLQRLAEGPGLTGTGFDGDDLDSMLDAARARDDDSRSPNADADDLPEGAPTVCQPGDVWQLGPHRLVCGDSTDPDTVTLALDGHPIDLVVTSPPYNVDVDYGDDHDDDRADWSTYGPFLERCLRAFDEHLPTGRLVCWNIGTHPSTHWARQAVLFDDLGYHQHRTLIWRKVGVPVPTWHNTRTAERVRVFWPNRSHELVLVMVKGATEPKPSKRAAIVDDLFEMDVFTLAQSMATRDLPDDPTAPLTGSSTAQNLQDRSRKAHPAPYPVALPRGLAGMLADPGAIVFDPFAGAGSTIIAADVANRVGVGVELSPKFCDVALARWQKHDGAPPVRDGEPVDFLAG